MNKDTELMAQDEQDTIRLREALKSAYARPASSDDFGRRLQQMAAERDAKESPFLPRRNRLWQAGWATAVAMMALAVGVLGISRTREASARKMMTLASAAVAKATTAYVREWRTLDNGAEKVDREIWYSAGKWLIKDDFNIVLQRDGLYYDYLLKLNRVNVSRMTWETPLLSMTELLRQFQASGIDDRAHLLPDAVVAGRNAHRVLLEMPPSGPNGYFGEATPMRAFLAIDPATDLPFQTETQAYHNGAWKSVLIADARYNEPVPETLFAADFPGAKVFLPEALEADAREQFHQRMADSKIKATVGDKIITLRGFATTELGDAFVFYTIRGADTNDPPSWNLELRDQTARHYQRLGGGLVGRSLPELASRWTFGGERLYVDWFRPDGRGSLDDYGGWQARFRFADGAEATLVPDLKYLCNGAIGSDEPYQEFVKEQASLLIEACRDEAEWFMDGRWKANAPLLRSAMKGDMDPLTMALSCYREAARLEEKSASLNGRHPDTAEDKRKIADIQRQRKISQK